MQTTRRASTAFTDELEATFGLHGQYLDLNQDAMVEPRAALSWQFRPQQRRRRGPRPAWSVGAASDAALSATPADGGYARTNADLSFMKSHHAVLAYDRGLGNDWRLKLEAYHQWLFDLPVEPTPSSYSAVNEARLRVHGRGGLVSEGTGTNMGLELTVEVLQQGLLCAGHGVAVPFALRRQRHGVGAAPPSTTPYGGEPAGRQNGPSGRT